MTRALNWAARLVLENFWWKVISLGVAVAIWALVASEPELSTFATVRVEYKNLPSDLEISAEPQPSVLLELQGPAGELRAMGETSLHPGVVLDLSGVVAGERTFAIDKYSVRLVRGVRLVRAVPPQVGFDFEPRGKRSVPVRIRIVGEGRDGYGNGYVVGGERAQPDHVDIVGPSSRVARVSAAVTDPVDVSAVTGSSQFQVNAFVDDPYVRLVVPARIAVTVTMKKK